MNVLYLLEILKTKKLSELIQNIDLPLIDINLALFDAEKAREVEINRKKDKIVALQEATPTCNEALADKLYRVMQHYEDKEVNITVGKLTSWVKNPMIEYNYPYHEYIIALQYLIDTKKVIEYEMTVPKTKNRPFHRFVFLGLPGNDNEEWNAREINKFISDWKPDKVQ